MSLHPRAVRMGLERVIEHERVLLKETPLLSAFYDQWINPLLTDKTIKKPLSKKQIKDFLARESKAEQEDWAQAVFKEG